MMLGLSNIGATRGLGTVPGGETGVFREITAGVSCVWTVCGQIMGQCLKGSSKIQIPSSKLQGNFRILTSKRKCAEGGSNMRIEGRTSLVRWREHSGWRLSLRR